MRNANFPSMKHSDRRSLPSVLVKTSGCIFCLQGKEVEAIAGKLHKRFAACVNGRVSLHHHCAYFASGLAMREDEDDDPDNTLDGFHVKDIISEARRAAKLRCSVCGKGGATIGCVDEKCQAKYHFPCAEKAQAMHVFGDSFPTYCRAHRPTQNLRKRARSLLGGTAAEAGARGDVRCDRSTRSGPGTSRRGDSIKSHSQKSPNARLSEAESERLDALLAELTCPVCLDSLKDCYMDPIKVVHGGCCPKSFFHRSCIQDYARSAGYFFCCPLCKDQKIVSSELRDFGIEIPERDAAWELEADAFNELYQRHSRCDARKCYFSGGRNESIDYHVKWDHIICSTCGWKGTHRFCSELDKKPEKDVERWQCEECVDIWTEQLADDRAESDVGDDSNECKRQRNDDDDHQTRSHVASSRHESGNSMISSSQSVVSTNFQSRGAVQSAAMKVSISVAKDDALAEVAHDFNCNPIGVQSIIKGPVEPTSAHPRSSRCERKREQHVHDKGSSTAASSLCASPTNSVVSHSSVLTRTSNCSFSPTGSNFGRRERLMRHCTLMGSPATSGNTILRTPRAFDNSAEKTVRRSGRILSMGRMKRLCEDSDLTVDDVDDVSLNCITNKRRRTRATSAASNLVSATSLLEESLIQSTSCRATSKEGTVESHEPDKHLEECCLGVSSRGDQQVDELHSHTLIH